MDPPNGPPKCTGWWRCVRLLPLRNGKNNFGVKFLSFDYKDDDGVIINPSSFVCIPRQGDNQVRRHNRRKVGCNASVYDETYRDMIILLNITHQDKSF